MKRILLAITLIALGISLTVGCSSRNPVVIPVKDSPNTTDDFSPIFIPESTTGEMTVGRGLLGVFKLHASLENRSAELLPLRNTSNEGDSFLTNVMSYFTSVPCTDCLAISNARIDSQNHLVLTFKVKHPFPPADTAQPPSGKNRDDLRIFDVKLIVVTEGLSEFPSNEIVLDPAVMINPDGYTSMEDLIIDKANDLETNAFPYIILAKDPTEGNVDPSATTGWK